MPSPGLEDPPKGKKTGVYAADLVPGNYIRSQTGVVRGEELFSRPDLERPWRTTSAQKAAVRITLKEKEIEELTRLCSNLRTELGNAKSDMRFLEYTLNEKMKVTSGEKDRTIESLNAQIDTLKKERAALKDDTEHQIRLLQSQHANEMMSIKNDARLAADRATELEKECKKQLEDARAAGAREVQFVETRLASQVDALNAELRAEKEAAKAAKQHYLEQTAANDGSVKTIETDFKERIQASEDRLTALRKLHAEELAAERKGKEDALAEARRYMEQLALLRVEREDYLQRFKVWNRYLLSELDRYYNRLIGTFPGLAVEPTDPRLASLPFLYAPRAVLEGDGAAKLTLERILYRLQQLSLLQSPAEWGAKVGEGSGGGAGAGTVDALFERLYAKQERLQAGLKELTERVDDADARLGGVLCRLLFFSEDFAQSLAAVPPQQQHVPPPRRNVVFVGIVIAHGAALWAGDGESMRAAVALFHHTVRLKRAEYGGYECYSDAVAMLLAFDHAVSACRFCAEAQQWLLLLPWPEFTDPASKFLCKEEHDTGRTVLFKGLRIAMAVHVGECFIEDSAIPTADGGCRAHYYGKALSQLVHISALAQGGQILISKPAWSLCARHRDDLRSLAVIELGSFQILSFNHVGMQEKQSIELLQLLPAALKARVFKPTSAIEIPAASPLVGMKSFFLSTEVNAITQRRSALEESMNLVKVEFHTIEAELRALMDHARAVGTHFHLLSPPEMVDQLNELYVVMEKVAVRAEEVYSDISHLMIMQEDLEVQSQGLREYLKQHLSQAKTEELRVEIDVINHRAQAALQTAEQKHRTEIENYKLSLAERDHTIRKLYKLTASKGEKT